MSGNISYPKLAGWSMGYSQPANADGAQDGIAASDPAEVILNYLLSEADRQMASLIRKEDTAKNCAASQGLKGSNRTLVEKSGTTAV